MLAEKRDGGVGSPSGATLRGRGAANQPANGVVGRWTAEGVFLCEPGVRFRTHPPRETLRWLYCPAMGWLRDGFIPPGRVELRTSHHLRPIREADVDIDYRAVMGSRERLWARYGQAWGWPPATMSYEDDRRDLARHEAEIAARETFNYAVLDEREINLLGCVYIDPPDERCPPGSDALASWWVVDDVAWTELERLLDEFVPHWLIHVWGFHSVHYDP